MLHNTITYEFSYPSRTIVIGDIHGDLKRFKNILIDANIINNDLEWIAEPQETIVIQLGDQVDSMNRAPDIHNWEVLDDITVIHFTDSLDNIAKAKGGRVISLIGNHELMNVIGNFSYVSSKSNVPNRTDYFKPTGILSTVLANRPLVIKIGQHFFCHAGIKKQHLDLLHKYEKPVSYINEVWRQFMLTGTISVNDKELFDKLLLDMDGILWTRTVDDNDDMTTVLNTIGCEYIFIGHTTVEKVQLVGNRLWYVDTGISRAFGSMSYQYIDINNYNISVKTITDNEQ
jgi:hypothetical protein